MQTKTTIPSYREALKELQDHLGKALPSEALEVFDADANQLRQNHPSILQLHPGDSAPDFSLLNAHGDTIRLSDLLSQGRVVLTFYRGTWCPYCNLQLNQYQQVLGEMNALGAQLVAISPQTPDESLSITEKNNLQFEVLSDVGNLVARRYTTVFKNGEAPIQAMKELGIDFENHYSDNSNELPVPAVFIIEKDGTVSFARAMDGDYRNRVEASDILKGLNSK